MASSQDNTNFLTYTNTDLGFTIKYLSDWLVNESNTALGLKSPDGASFVLVSTSNLPNGTSMSGEELAKTFISHQPFEFRPIEVNTNNYFLSGHPAARIIGIASFGRPGEPGAFHGIEPHDVKMMLLSTTLEGKAYTVGYMSLPESFNSYLQIAQTMIDSFQIITKQ